MPTLNDEDLIRELKAGNMSAFKELFDEYSSLVFNVALRMLQNKEDAEDVTQDTFLQAHVSIKNFRSESQLSTWLYRIDVNTSLNFQRKMKRARFLSPNFVSNEPEDARKSLPHKRIPRKTWKEAKQGVSSRMRLTPFRKSSV